MTNPILKHLSWWSSVSCAKFVSICAVGMLSNSICSIIFKTKGGQIKPPINQIYTI